MLKPACRAVPLALAVLAALAAPGRADDRLEVDIDSLKAELWRSGGEWLLDVRYEIEIEDFAPRERFELILYLTERGRVLTDPDGRPLEIVVPLDEPSEVDDDELEFEAGLTVPLPDRALRDPRKLKIHATVVHAGRDAPLEHKKKSVKFKRPHRRRRPSFGVSFGYCGVGFGIRF